MNIFETDTTDQIDLRNQKIDYLAYQNNWISKQYQIFCQLIYKYKTIIEITINKQINVSQCRQKLNDLNQFIEDCIENCKEFCKSDIQNEQIQANPLEFFKLIVNFESAIKQFRDQTMKYEDILQGLQDKKVQYQRYVEKIKKQQNATIQTIQGHDIYPIMFDNFKTTINNLRIKKKNIEQQLKAIQFQSKKQIESTSSTIESQQFRKALKTELELEAPIPKKEQLSSFEKVILIYKKKKFTNSKLKQKINLLKHRIQNKRCCIDKFESLATWSDLTVINEKQNLVNDDNIEMFSFVNNISVIKSNEFDIDFSKIINLKQRKTYEAYKSTKKQE